MLDMQPDPVMLERQKQEQLIKQQRSEHIRVRIPKRLTPSAIEKKRG
jgi:hypothetical protein